LKVNYFISSPPAKTIAFLPTHENKLVSTPSSH